MSEAAKKQREAGMMTCTGIQGADPPSTPTWLLPPAIWPSTASAVSAGGALRRTNWKGTIPPITPNHTISW